MGFAAERRPRPRVAGAVTAARQTASWKRHARAAFGERLGLKASAVALAVALWFIVAAREPTEDVAPVRFSPQLDSALVLRDPAPPIRALVIGRPSEILKLTNTPLVIRRPVDNGVPDTLVLALRPSDVEVPEGVGVIVRDVQPHSLTLRFETSASRRVSVRSEIYVRAPIGPPIGVRLDPESVTVVGPRRAVAQLQFVPTLSDSIVLDTLPHLIDLDTAGLGGLGVSVRPLQVKATFRRIPSGR
jgi:hypothetical protein